MGLGLTCLGVSEILGVGIAWSWVFRSGGLELVSWQVRVVGLPGSMARFWLRTYKGSLMDGLGDGDLDVFPEPSSGVGGFSLSADGSRALSLVRP